MENIVTEQSCTQEEVSIETILKLWGYRNPRIIGRGAFAWVYRVQDSRSGIIHACKVSREQEMLQKEGVLLRQISHPLFPAFHSYKQQNGYGFLFMEYVWGVNLRTLLDRRGYLVERQAIRISMELAEGLRYLHERSTPILFRDVKPENIVIKQDGRVKLLDLGSASPMNGERNAITGTPGYAAPEQWEGEINTGFYSDVYALGQVLYSMLSGGKPYVFGRGIHEAKGQYPYRTKVHRGIRYLIEDCVKECVGERVPDMRNFIHRLKPYVAEKRSKIWYQEIKAILHAKNRGEYIFQQNIMRL